jgi:hypothetical protein
VNTEQARLMLLLLLLLLPLTLPRDTTLFSI